MSHWMPEMDEHTPTIVREAWRRQLFDDVAEQRAALERVSSVRTAVVTGVIAGVVGSVAIYLFA